MKKKLLLIFILLIGVFTVASSPVLAAHTVDANGKVVDVKSQNETKKEEKQKAATHAADQADFLGFCSEEHIMAVFKLGGVAIMIIKIVVPILLIILGMLDMAKAVVSGSDDGIKKSTGTFVRRLAVGALVFLAPTILMTIFNLISEWTKVQSTFQPCLSCLFDIKQCGDVSIAPKLK